MARIIEVLGVIVVVSCFTIGLIITITSTIRGWKK